MDQPTIAIVGASANRNKFGNRAVRAYVRRGYRVFPINPRETTIEGLQVVRSILDVPVDKLDRVSIYLPPEIGWGVIEEIAQKQPREVWLNPGAASDALLARGKELGLSVVVGCSIVDIGMNPHET